MTRELSATGTRRVTKTWGVGAALGPGTGVNTLVANLSVLHPTLGRR